MFYKFDTKLLFPASQSDLNLFEEAEWFSSDCVKCVQIRSFFWSIFSCIQSEYRKIRTKKTSYLDTFHAVSGH